MVNYLYIHIPFCIKKCIYCDFYSVPFKSHIAEYYIEALCKEIQLRRCSFNSLKTIYIGGGTPTILSAASISKILNAIKESYSIMPDAEIAIEANPNTLIEKSGSPKNRKIFWGESKIEELLKSGINRLSIGIQSFIDDELAVLGRSHNADGAIKTVENIRRYGFRNISIDLIYGIPLPSNQESGVRSQELQIQNWQCSLQKALELNPEHISTYELTPEKDTPLYDDIKNDDIKKGRLAMPEEEAVSEMYYKGIDMLKYNGYIHYEISNFAKPGRECIHNLNYWNRGEYIGIGAGAHSFFDKKRTLNVRDVMRYIETVNIGMTPVDEEVEITPDDALKEFIFLGLRKTEGINIGYLPAEKRHAFNKAVEFLVSHGLVELDDNYLRLTRKGLIMSSEVIVQILLSIE
jgi:oxygen-independent coproporphyrinogen-3 oxidase